jgi:hypothetical protein
VESQADLSICRAMDAANECLHSSSEESASNSIQTGGPFWAAAAGFDKTAKITVFSTRVHTLKHDTVLC